jgi:hypothetical protein
MRRFSVRTLMLLIVGAAVGLAALRNANVYWAMGMSIALIGTLATSAVGALILRGKEQCACAGFAVFCVVYLGVTVSGLSDLSAPLSYVSQVAGYSTPPVFGNLKAARSEEAAELESAEASGLNEGDLRRLKNNLKELDEQIESDQASTNSADRWRSWLPGAVNAGEFLRVGHSLFALLSGLAGSVVGTIFYARRQRSETQTP